MNEGEYVAFVGGPAHGEIIERPKGTSVTVPVYGGTGIGAAIYTMRRCQNDAGGIVEVLAPAGRDIDRKWLAENGLKN